VSAAERAAAAQERIGEQLEALLAVQTRRERREALDRQAEADRVGSRSQPRRIGIDLALQRFPGLAGEFRRIVPPEFWTKAGSSAAAVACPCGVEEPPTVTLNQTVTCVCDRAYLYTGEHVRVAFSPPSVAADAAEKS
jgi:hypothetical protein